MNDIRVNRGGLLAKLKTNREQHRELFLKAQDKYREAVIEELDAMLTEAREGKRIRRAVTLKAPIDQTAEYDRAGTMLGGSMVWATARDWGQFGEFLRHKGSVAGTQVLPRAWIEFMETPSPRAPDYGALLWLNRPSGVKTRHVLFAERGPKSLVAAVGHLGQYVIVAPDQQLTVVRLGKTDTGQRPALENALADVVARYR